MSNVTQFGGGKYTGMTRKGFAYCTVVAASLVQVKGTGFTVTRTGLGVFLITYTVAQGNTAAPVLEFASEGTGASTATLATLSSFATGSVVLTTVTAAGSALDPIGFYVALYF